jgi:hypothetical protein
MVYNLLTLLPLKHHYMFLPDIQLELLFQLHNNGLSIMVQNSYLLQLLLKYLLKVVLKLRKHYKNTLYLKIL